jgi:hypothetical protein
MDGSNRELADKLRYETDPIKRLPLKRELLKRAGKKIKCKACRLITEEKDNADISKL